MATTRTTVPHPPESVFAVLSDGWRYAEWVVGAKRIRAVDDGWPAPGTKFHHRVGVGPLTIDDNTECESVDPPSKIVLQARAWPAGKARVTIELTPVEGGTEVVMHEAPIAGPAKTIDSPPLHVLIHLRNVESLRRLKAAVGRSARV